MTTLGNTSKPTSTIEAWDGPYEIMANLQSMPSGGPWLITRVGVWAAGYAGVSCNAKVCVWSAGGSLVAQSATFTLVGESFANGNVSLYEKDLQTPYEVSGGTNVYVGLHVELSGGYQFGRYSSGTHYDYNGVAFPGNFGSGGSHTPGASAYLVYETANTAPNAPTNLSPTGNEVVDSGTAPTVSGTRSDPDSGDYITAYQILAYEDDGTTQVYNSGKVSTTGTPTTFSKAISLPGSHAYYKWKARTWDKEDVAGSYSSLQRFYANAVPSKPSLGSVSSTSTLTPSFSGSFSDPGDTLSGVQIVVQRSSDSNEMWDSGTLSASGSSWSGKVYAGSSLAWSTQYKFKYRTKDSHGAWSSYSNWKTWTTSQPAGPDNMSPTSDNPYLTDLTPNLTVGHSANFRNDEVQVRTTPGGGTLLWNKTWDGSDYANTTSKVRTYAGTALSNGVTYYWRARIELSSDGTITSWSDWYPFREYAVPNAPTGLTPTGGIVTTDTTPQLKMQFSDPDEDQGDSASLVDVEVRLVSDSSLVWSQTGATPVPSGSYDHVVDVGSTLTNEVQYKWRARFTDSDGLVGPWSAYQNFKVSQPPSATLNAPTDASTVTESTPTLDWSFSSPGGKTQYSYRIYIYDKGPTGSNYADEELVWDSGDVISTNETRDVPYGILENDHDYRWELVVKDTDLLSYTLT